MMSFKQKLLHTPVGHLQKINNKESSLSRHIPILGHYTDDTLIGKNGELTRLFQLQGFYYRTASPSQLDEQKHLRERLLNIIGSEFIFYSWLIRRPITLHATGQFPSPYANDLNHRYYETLNKKVLYQNRLFIGITTHTNQNEKTVLTGISALSLRKDRLQSEKALEKRFNQLNTACQVIKSLLKDYDIKPLGVKEHEEILVSESLSFIGELINSDPFPMPLLTSDASMYLGRYRLFFNPRSGIIEYRLSDGHSRFAAVLSIKVYEQFTYAGLLDALNDADISFTLTQSFLPFDISKAKSLLKHHQKDLIQAEDDALSQTENINDAIDSTAGGETIYGKYHFTLLCFAESIEALKQQVATLTALFTQQGLLIVKEDIACELHFWAQCPGNQAYQVRATTLSSRNVASFISFHNEPVGKANDNHWGDAVTVLETLSRSPYYFNFHWHDNGNTLLFGRMGSGKTLLMGFLLAQSLKLGGKRIVLDKDRGLEILVRALGGRYEVLTPGKPTGFNPCQLPDTAENRYFLFQLFCTIFSPPASNLTEAERLVIQQVIDRLYSLPFDARQFRHIAPLFGIPQEGSLRLRFNEWHSEGPYAWVFDHPQKDILETTAIRGYEFGAILDDPITHTPLLMTLFHQSSQWLEGERGGIFMDEGWKALSNPYLRNFINDLGRTPRKKNQFFCFATQSIEDAVNEDICQALITSATTKIFFANPEGSKESYCEKLGLSLSEYQWIQKELVNHPYYFLLRHGPQSIIVKAPFESLLDDIAIISGRTSSIRLLDQLRNEVGDDPKDWLPLFRERCQKR